MNKGYDINRNPKSRKPDVFEQNNMKCHSPTHDKTIGDVFLQFPSKQIIFYDSYPLNERQKKTFLSLRLPLLFEGLFLRNSFLHTF